MITSIDSIKQLEDLAREYRRGATASIALNSHMNDLKGVAPDQSVVDAVLVNFINYIAWETGGVDYALYTHDLQEKV